MKRTPEAMQTSLDAAEGWAVPPRCQGQMVEVSYAIDGESQILWRRVHDRSDGSSTYAHADAGDYDLDQWDPANREPTGIQWLPAEVAE